MSGIILDTQLLVLLAVGITAENLIDSHKNTKTYTRDDFVLLKQLVNESRRIILIPNIVTETSNLLGQSHRKDAIRLRQTLRHIIDYYSEIYIDSRFAVAHASYLELGVTDAAIMIAHTLDTTIVTGDFDLYRTALNLKLKVINFNHLRDPT